MKLIQLHGHSMGGGNDEREQTLNQILTWMGLKQTQVLLLLQHQTRYFRPSN
jgi:ATP-dependent Zn protease